MCKRSFLALSLLLFLSRFSFSDGWDDPESLPVLGPLDTATLSGPDWNELRTELITRGKELAELSKSLGALKSRAEAEILLLKVTVGLASAAGGGFAGYAFAGWGGVPWGAAAGAGVGFVIDLSFP